MLKRLAPRWRSAALVVAAFAVLAAIFAAVTDRKDADYWSGYTDAQHWVDDGGYAAADESIDAYCRGRTAAAHRYRNYERGCVAGGRNAMKSGR